MKVLKICLLGRPFIEWRGRQVNGFVSEKALALFAYLVLVPGSQAREKLAGLFWGDKTASRARANLRMALYNLGQLFPDYLQTSRLSVSFERQLDYWLDVEQFEKVLSAKDGLETISIPALEKALSLYRGDLLEGIYLNGSPELDEWLLMAREHLKQLALGGFQLYAGKLMEAGEFTGAAQAWQKLLRLEPWQETAHQGLMLALARKGEYTAALEQYEVCQRLLREELGVEPMPETTRIYARIRAARDLPSRHNLPLQPTPFIGRERELKDLRKILANPGERLITISGPGGAGKTRLALQAAAGQVHAMLHGVYFVPLESLSSPEGLPAAIGSSLGLSFQGKTSLRSQLLNYLLDREILLVLDNFEHLLGGADLAAEILMKAPQVKILVTSRQRLNLREERLIHLSGLGTPGSGLEESWQEYAAVQLFLEAGRRASNHFSPGKRDRPAILRICELVEGMPLGIEMAAAWVDHLSSEEIASAIEANLASLASSLRNVPERHRSLRAVFDHSWYLLNEEERCALRKLSLFRGGFTVQAAVSVAGASGMILKALVDKSLLQVAPLPDGSYRYRPHELIRQLAYEKLHKAGEELVLHEKHLEFFLKFSEEASSMLNQADQAIWVERIEQEHSNLLDAMEWSKNRKETSTSGLRLAVAMAEFWEIRGYFKVGLDRLQSLMDSRKAIPTDLRLKALLSTARLAFLSGEYELSRSIYKDSIRLCQESQNSLGLLDSLNGLVAVLTDQGEYRQAGQFGEQALALARQSEDREKIALAANNLGLLGWYQGDYLAARRYLEESLELRRLAGNPLGVGYALNNLALVILDEGGSDEATQLLEESLAIRRAVGDRRGTAFVLGNLGIIAQYQGDFIKAKVLLKESLAIRRELEDRRYIAHTLGNLGTVAQSLGNYKIAREYYDEGLSIARRLEDPVIIAFLTRGLGSLLSDLLDYEEARPLLEEAVSLERAIGSGRSLGMALEKMGKLALRTGDLGLAQTALEESCELFTNIHYQRGMARAHSLLGSLAVQLEEAPKAVEHFKISYQMAARMGNPLEIAGVLEGIASLAQILGKPVVLPTLLGRAHNLRETGGASLPPPEQLEVQRLIKAAREKVSAPEFSDRWEKGVLLTDEQCSLILDSLMVEWK